MNLSEIKEIVRVLKNYESLDTKPLDLSNLDISQSKESKLIKLIFEKNVERDEDAAFEIYGSSEIDSKFKFLKSNTISRLLNNIVFLDLAKSGISDHTKAIYKAYKNLLNVSILLRLGSRSGAISIAKKTLPIAYKYELHHVAIELLIQLRFHSLQMGNKKEYVKFSKELETRINFIQSETEIETLENEIRINFTNSLFIDEKIKIGTRQALNGIRTLLKTNSTYMGWVAYYRLSYILHQVEGHPLRSIRACDEGIKYMMTMPHMTPQARLGEFALYKFENHLLLKDFENGMIVAKDCEKFIREGSNLWFKFKENQFLLSMQTLRFDEAYSIYQNIFSHERFNAQPEHIRQRWEIFKYYIHYAEGIQMTDSKRIINVPAYAKDKAGFNVALLLINILRLLEEKKYDQLIRQVETLSTYRFKYLSGKYSRQSFLLFKLINIMIGCQFDLAKVEKKALRIESELKTIPLNSTEIFECIQVLPPNWIWNRMKSLLPYR